MSAPALVYIHGFNSSPGSAKARLVGSDLARAHPEVAYRVPALPAEPGAGAIAVLERELDALAAAGHEAVLLGSSLGGFYATWLAERRGLRAVLVNPSVQPFAHFHAYLGEQRNLHTGERYRLDERHIGELRALDVPRIRRPQDFLVLLQTGDETLDWRQAAEKYADCSVLKQLGGNHGFEHFEDVLPLIYRFAHIL